MARRIFLWCLSPYVCFWSPQYQRQGHRGARSAVIHKDCFPVIIQQIHSHGKKNSFALTKFPSLQWKVLHRPPSTAVGTGPDRPFPTETPTRWPNALLCLQLLLSTAPGLSTAQLPHSAIWFQQPFFAQQDAEMCIWTRGFCITILCCKYLKALGLFCVYQGHECSCR